MTSYSFVKNSANDQTVEETQLVLVYELGKLFECLHNYVESTKLKAFAQTELADLVSMCRMLCEQKHWDFDTMCEDDFWPSRSYTPIELLCWMQIQLSRMIRGNHYLKRFGKFRGVDPRDAMKDLIFWVQYLCEQMQWDFRDTCRLGEQRYEERMRDLREDGLNNRLKKECRRDESDR